MGNYNFKEFWPDKIFRIRRVKDDVSQTWLQVKDQAYPSALHLLGCGDVSLNGDLDTLGEEEGDEAPGQIK